MIIKETTSGVVILRFMNRKVYCLRYGESVITEVRKGLGYVIVTKNHEGVINSYLSDGKLFSEDAVPMLYPNCKPEITPVEMVDEY